MQTRDWVIVGAISAGLIFFMTRRSQAQTPAALPAVTNYYDNPPVTQPTLSQQQAGVASGITYQDDKISVNVPWESINTAYDKLTGLFK